MKKLILTESQVKNVISQLLKEESEIAINKSLDDKKKVAGNPTTKK